MTLWRLFAPVWRKQWPWLVLGLALMLLSALAALTLLGLSGWLITASAMAGVGLLAAVDIFTPGGGIRLAALTRTVARYGERLATHRASLSLLAGLRVRLLSKLLMLDEIQLRRLQRGETLDRLTRDVEALDPLFSTVAGPTLTAVLITLGLSTAFGLLLGPLAALGVLLAAVLIAAIGAMAVRVGTPILRRQSLDDPTLRRACTEALEGLSSLIAEARVNDRAAEIEAISTRQIARRTRLDRIDAVGRGLVNASGLALVWTLLALAGWALGASSNHLSGPVAVLVVLVGLGTVEVWQNLPAAWRQALRARLSAQRLDRMASATPVLPRYPDETPRAPADGRVCVSSLTFAWPDGSRPVLDDLDFELDDGERLLVTGPSGCGKTTLALLLMRQIDPVRGAIRLGGKELRDYHPDALRRAIGYLPQQPVVFADTLAANLRIAAPNADEQRLSTVLEHAGLGDWLAGLEAGLETWLDEAGANLSGGERRRLGLARLMLSDPSMVILDEPTTGLDAETAISLSGTLDAWLAGRSAVLISHEPDLLPRYDRRLTL
jgi:ATP-binding cassette subfamily C protein CydC